MLDYTKKVFAKTVEDLKMLAFVCSLALQSFQIFYLIYALCSGSGILAANIALLAISSAYLIFMIYIRWKQTKKEIRRLFKTIYRWGKRLIKLFTLGVSVYGIYITYSQTATVSTIISVILLVFMLLAWVLDLLLEVTIRVAEKRGKMFFEAFKEDMANLPIVGGWLEKKMKGNTEANQLQGEEIAPKEDKKIVKKRAKLQALLQKTQRKLKKYTQEETNEEPQKRSKKE